jgi:hypothetical protein
MRERNTACDRRVAFYERHRALPERSCGEITAVHGAAVALPHAGPVLLERGDERHRRVFPPEP